MKTLIKKVVLNLVAMLVSLAIFSTFSFVLFLVITSFLAKGSKTEPDPLGEDTILVMDLGFILQDKPGEFRFEDIFREISGDESVERVGFYHLQRMLKAAAQDETISAIYLTGNLVPGEMGTNLALIMDLREALIHFKEDSGKAIYGYMESASIRDYLLYSVADHIVLNPMGRLGLNGLSAQVLFMGEAFEKFGIGVEVAKAGAYKSGPEPYYRDSFSDPARQDIQELLDNVWGDMVAQVAASRGLSPDLFETLANENLFLLPAKALELGLVDDLAYFDQVLAYLKEKGTPTQDELTFRQVYFLDYLDQYVPSEPAGENRLAVVYAEGVIVSSGDEFTQISGQDLSRTLRMIRQDDDIDAVVLRVNSPGGGVYGSELIQREVELLSQEKPTVVSMSGIAASGGYWISTGAEDVIASPLTLTGSIGVYSVLFQIEELANRWGFHFDTIKTSKMADAMNGGRPMTEEEKAQWQGQINHIYDDFLSRVADARGWEKEKAMSLAGGKVWLGNEALANGLVDRLGGLLEAIDWAKEKSEKEDESWEVVEYPAPKNMEQFILEAFDIRVALPALREFWGSGVPEFMRDHVEELRRMTSVMDDPHQTYMMQTWKLQ